MRVKCAEGCAVFGGARRAKGAVQRTLRVLAIASLLLNAVRGAFPQVPASVHTFSDNRRTLASLILQREPHPHRSFASMLGGRRSISIMSSHSQHPVAPSPPPHFTITAREGKARCATLTTPAGGKHCSHGS